VVIPRFWVERTRTKGDGLLVAHAAATGTVAAVLLALVNIPGVFK